MSANAEWMQCTTTTTRTTATITVTTTTTSDNTTIESVTLSALQQKAVKQNKSQRSHKRVPCNIRKQKEEIKQQQHCSKNYRNCAIDATHAPTAKSTSTAPPKQVKGACMQQRLRQSERQRQQNTYVPNTLPQLLSWTQSKTAKKIACIA